MTHDFAARLQIGDRVLHPRLGLLQLKDISLSPRDVGTGMGGEGGFSVRVFLFEQLDTHEEYEIPDTDLEDSGMKRVEP